MLHLLDKNLSRIGSFETYGSLIDYIHHSRIRKLRFLIYRTYPFDSVLDGEESNWRFVYYKHAQLRTVYSCMKEPPLTQIEKEAFDQELDLIELYQGDPARPLQIPVTDDVNIQQLQRNWCESYCKTHEYSITETFNNESVPESPGTGGSDDLGV